MEASVKEVPMWDCIFRIQRRTSWAARLGSWRRLVKVGGDRGGVEFTRGEDQRDLGGQRCSLRKDH